MKKNKLIEKKRKWKNENEKEKVETLSVTE